MIALSRQEDSSLTDSAIGAQASALIVAGSGTTAVSLTYAIWAILSHPDVGTKLEEEVSRIPADYDDTVLESLPYLKAVITEVLRLYGSAPGSLPRVVPPRGLHVGGHFVPAGVTVTTQSYTMHRDPEIFPCPEKYVLPVIQVISPGDSPRQQIRPIKIPRSRAHFDRETSIRALWWRYSCMPRDPSRRDGASTWVGRVLSPMSRY